MLQWMRIRNLAVIDDLTWELGEGLNILTGETGAGKSILIDAFNLLLGERADRTLIRDGAESCSVEAVLSKHPLVEAMLAEQGMEPSEESLLLKRTFSNTGQNKQFVNGSPATLAFLQKIGNVLVDIHGPHDHQTLLSNAAQLDALDSFAKLENDRAAYLQLWKVRQEEVRTLEELRGATRTDWQQRIDFLDYQIQEISAAAFDADEEERLTHDYHLAKNHQRIMELSGSVQDQLSQSENNLLDSLGALDRLLQEWERIDAGVADLREMAQTAALNLQDLDRAIAKKVHSMEMDESKLAELEQRMDLLQTLKRKYGASIPLILDEQTKLQRERDDLASREERIATLEKSIQNQMQQIEKTADALSKKRAEASGKLATAITAQLHELGFKQAGFDLQLSRREEPGATGRDHIEFLFAPNLGQSARPLKSIASSGEMARVMLAVKTVLAQHDAVPILIFDEVDANVGGETAVVVGRKLSELGESHQVLCITHLPQVAGAGSRHYRVEKRVDKGTTKTDLKLLEQGERVDELARMLGGKSEQARAMAEELMGKSIAPTQTKKTAKKR